MGVSEARQVLEKQLQALEGYRKKLVYNLDLVQGRVTACQKALEILEMDAYEQSFEQLAQFELEAVFWEDDLEPRKPEDLKRGEFLTMTLAQAVLSVIYEIERNQGSNAEPISVSIDELVKMIYSPKPGEEFLACKATLTSAINRCVKAGSLERSRPGIFKLGQKTFAQLLSQKYEQFEIAPNNRSG